MSKDLKSLRVTQIPAALADEALDQMFGYYHRDPGLRLDPANDSGHRVISELDAAAAILAAKRVA